MNSWQENYRDIWLEDKLYVPKSVVASDWLKWNWQNKIIDAFWWMKHCIKSDKTKGKKLFIWADQCKKKKDEAWMWHLPGARVVTHTLPYHTHQFRLLFLLFFFARGNFALSKHTQKKWGIFFNQTFAPCSINDLLLLFHLFRLYLHDVGDHVFFPI